MLLYCWKFNHDIKFIKNGNLFWSWYPPSKSRKQINSKRGSKENPEIDIQMDLKFKSIRYYMSIFWQTRYNFIYKDLFRSLKFVERKSCLLSQLIIKLSGLKQVYVALWKVIIESHSLGVKSEVLIEFSGLLCDSRESKFLTQIIFCSSHQEKSYRGIMSNFDFTDNLWKSEAFAVDWQPRVEVNLKCFWGFDPGDLNA